MVEVVICEIMVPYEAGEKINESTQFIVLTGGISPMQIGDYFESYEKASDSLGGSYFVVSSSRNQGFFETKATAPQDPILKGGVKYESNSVIAFEPDIGVAVIELIVWEGEGGHAKRSESQPVSPYILAQLGMGRLSVLEIFSQRDQARSSLLALKARRDAGVSCRGNLGSDHSI
ncbi:MULTISPECIES: hypothetical protein [Xanthomonas]|uniref:hypothetical protein n=1 Tax=Xanthomonas TaxID=338 RepID=UPI001ADA782D|nr:MULTISPECIES: hypothetical protein [unclassified Xanthomonas]MBO9873939.1 hypothetical protein [Xanthomonas sp. D-93]WNH43847.1 hypothetical protein PG878_15150 [Xanthomonas sp. A6251]